MMAGLLDGWCMEEWEQRLEITSHPVDPKNWVSSWVEYGPISGRGCLLDEPTSQWEARIYIHVFVWCNHDIPELLIFTYSATPLPILPWADGSPPGWAGGWWWLLSSTRHFAAVKFDVFWRAQLPLLATALCLSLVGTRIRVLHFDIDRYCFNVERSPVVGGVKDLC